MKRIFVKDARDIQEDVFTGSLEKVTANLKAEVEKLKIEFPGSEEKGYVFDWYSDYDYQAVQIHFYRLENDREYADRKKKLETKLKRESKSLEKRKELYLELKKEFEDE